MRNKVFLVVTILALSLTGCAKYQADETYDTDLYGTYSKNIEAFTDDPNEINYTLNSKWVLNKDSYAYSSKEQIDGQTTHDIDRTGDILSIEEISKDITKITTDQTEVDFTSQEEHNEVLYKYKNVLGEFYKIEIPKGKTFELHLNSYVWFDEKGQYHSCSNSDECDCAETMPQYIRKGNIIYMKPNGSNYYPILYYIVDGGLFAPRLYKE